jgi:cytochrome bd-type quinol oxidase subunit 2
MPNHFQALLLFALAVSAAFAMLSKQTTRERLRYLLWALLGFLAVAVGVGWLMYPFSR